MITPVCPRCNGYIPNDLFPGAYPGAISRVDNITEICSFCGTEEAMEQWEKGTVRAEWLINKEESK